MEKKEKTMTKEHKKQLKKELKQREQEALRLYKERVQEDRKKRQLAQEAKKLEKQHRAEVQRQNEEKERALQDNPDIICLLKKKKKGLLRIVFSRFGISAVLLLLQVAFFLLMLTTDVGDMDYVTILLAIFTVFMFIHLFKSNMSSSAKLTWLFLMGLFPIPASILLWYTEKDAGHMKIRQKMQNLIDTTKEALPQKDEVIHDPAVEASDTDALFRYLNLSGCFPLYRHTQATYYPLGEQKFTAMMEELRKAEKYIFMEYFIIGEGLMWGSILKVLAEKAAQGVEVRVMYDGMCEISTLTGDYPQRLEQLGIHCKPFTPIRPFVSTQYNYRDHRKILVIDGKVAFNGGVNLADEYINYIDRFGHWKDTAVMLKGEAVSSFTLMFLQMWNLSEKEPSFGDYLTDSFPAESDGYVMPYADCPLDGFKVGRSVYLDILNRAKRYVHIMTPYLILDDELATALKFAAQRGVDVQLILPGIPDKKMAFALAKSHYSDLLAAGIKIYEYTPGFVHAKIFVSDDEKAVVGTINLDYRSLYHHFECATYLYRCDCIPAIEADFQATLMPCRRVTYETIKNEKLSYKLRGSLMKVLAPLM